VSEFSCRGHRLHYRELGQGPSLLILPGNTASSAHHAEELAHFSAHFHAVAPDFLGTGQSDRLAQWPVTWFEDNAGDMAQLVAHLGEGPCVAIGTSGSSGNGVGSPPWPLPERLEHYRAATLRCCQMTH
jgi:valacyclovir hydrolase